MKTLIFFAICLFSLAFILWRSRRAASLDYNSVDAIIPAYNEEPCLAESLRGLLINPYIKNVICVNDGSTDNTEKVLEKLKTIWGDRLIAINQKNTGKGGALMNGLNYVTSPYVFLTDADTYVPPDKGLGYMIAEIEDGADAVGGIPSSNLDGAKLLPHIRATVKLPMIILKRTFQQIVGGAPFIISGACGMFKVEVLRKFGFSDRTKVEDLDLTWTLVAEGYKVRQANRCIVYPQECTNLGEEWKRWRRWIVGYAVCMRLHWKLIFSRFGFVSILPMVWVVMLGIGVYSISWAKTIAENGPSGLIHAIFPILWLGAVAVLGTFSAIHHKKWRLIPLSCLAVLYVFLSYAVWVVHGFKGIITGREPKRDKPTRYAYVSTGQ